jgi:RNA polymerase sigma-70 factor (ECF subfamily)
VLHASFLASIGNNLHPVSFNYVLLVNPEKIPRVLNAAILTPHPKLCKKNFHFFVIKYNCLSTIILEAFVQEDIRLQTIDWQLIVKRYGPIVWQTAYRLLGNHADAADCFSETFVCALELSQHQRIRSFSALLARLATARAIDRLRKRYSKSQAYVDQADLAAVPSANPGPLKHLQTKELQARLRQAISRLPAQQAEAFCLRYLNDMSYRQIAKQLGIRTSTAGVLLHRARAKLRDYFRLPPEE